MTLFHNDMNIVNTHVNPNRAGLLRWCLERIHSVLRFDNESSVVLGGGMIEIDIRDGVEVCTTSRLLFVLI